MSLELLAVADFQSRDPLHPTSASEIQHLRGTFYPSRLSLQAGEKETHPKWKADFQ